MRQRIGPGVEVDFLTPDELVKMLSRPEERTRIRVPATVQLDGGGNGVAEVYEVPAGYEFEVRRIVLSLSGNGPVDPSNAPVALNAIGHYVNYMRSGSLIEPGVPQYGGATQVPGVQTWGAEQGPYIRNKEVFEVRAVGLTPNGVLNVYLEGILTRPKEG